MVEHEIHQTEEIQHILIVDDVKEIQDYLSLLLSNLGYWSIDCADCAAQAYKKLQNKAYDLIFLDIELPDCNGKDILDRLTVEYPETTVVMCSSHNTLENVKQTWEMGAKGFLSKPFNEKKVSTIVRRLQRSN